MRLMCLTGTSIAVLAMLAGCGNCTIPSEEERAATIQETLLSEWDALAATEHDMADYERAAEIGAKLAEKGPEGLEPFFRIIESPEAEPMEKMLAVVSLSDHIDDTHIERLLALTAPEHDSVTRGCAVKLLGTSMAPDAMFRAFELMDDDDDHVSRVATMAMLRKGIDVALERALDLWEDPETPVRDRDEIILGIPYVAARATQPVFEEAICDDALGKEARMHAIRTIGYIATGNTLPLIEACLEEEEDPDLRAQMEVAQEEIQEREEQGIRPVPVEAPDSVELMFTPTAPETQDGE